MKINEPLDFKHPPQKKINKIKPKGQGSGGSSSTWPWEWPGVRRRRPEPKKPRRPPPAQALVRCSPGAPGRPPDPPHPHPRLRGSRVPATVHTPRSRARDPLPSILTPRIHCPWRTPAGCYKTELPGASLVVPWLGLHTSHARAPGSILISQLDPTMCRN